MEQKPAAIENRDPSDDGRGATILIVEDSPVQAELLRRALEGAGYKVIAAGDGAEGLAMAKASRPDAVVSDINMPVMDGYAMCQAIRREESLKATPVILLTMLSDPEDVIHGLNAGADAYLTKPYNIPSLVARLASLLSYPPVPPPAAERRKVKVRLVGKTYLIDAHGPRMLNLLISTYENAVLQNRELAATQQALEDLNQHLEQRVLEQTAALQISAARYERAVNGANDGIWEWIPATAEGYMSPHWKELLGYEDHELPNVQESFFNRIHSEDQALVREAVRAHLEEREPYEIELRLRCKNGEYRWFSARGQAEWDEQGRPLRMAGNLSDITERKRAEQEIRDLNASLERRVAERTLQLEEASRAKSDFLANMSHELRTPLNSIIGFSEMLKDGILGELDAKQRGFVTDIFDAGTHLLSLINDILDLSKVEAGMLLLEAGAVDVPALLKASTLVVREKALGHRIRLDTRLDPALGTVRADERKLKQIVYNLLSNAVKFTPEGGVVTLHARRCTRAEVALDEALPGRLIALPPGEDGEFLAITVEDTGVGIAEEHLPKLFQPFMQVDSSVARRQAGTGLGLSLVRRLAELHGGTVGVASRPGAGSRFCAWLPYREAVPAAQEGETVPEIAAPSAPAVPLALVIEDDDRMADLIAAQLHAEGFEVIRAATAEEGLVRAAKRRPQLITLDIFLPAMDGWEFLRLLRADARLAATPVVIITVSDDMDRGLTLGARRVLQKPFAREELVAALAGLVETRPDGEPGRVLVVDDNVKAVELVATALEAEGYRVLRAYGGAEAIEVARCARPDLVILDLMMPEVSGFEVARALRESEHTARIPILVLTAKDLTAEDHARLNGDVSAILAKASFSTSGLLAELRRALPKRAGD